MDRNKYNTKPQISASQIEKGLKSAVKAANSGSKSSNRFMTFFIIAVLIIAALLFLYDNGFFSKKDEPVDIGVIDDTKTAWVHYIDVGQGDCSLIVSDDGSAMLIDCGERVNSADVLSYLDNVGVKRLDYIIATHPHSDHIGGMSDIIDSDIEIGTFLMPMVADEFTPTTSTHERMIRSLSKSKCGVKILETDSFSLGGGTVEIITTGYSGDNYNNYSPIVRFGFGDRKFLFTGDAENTIEYEVLNAGYDISADVYKAGHHGSSTSSCPKFMAAIYPSCIVISCGAGNSYGHPHRETIALAKDYTDIILRTDVNGDIVFCTDGENLEYYTENE